MTLDENNLGLRLLRAESAAEVLTIVKKDRQLSNADNWHPLDGRDTNFNIFGNQATTGGKAATELITNMVDAMLTKHCLIKGISPKGADAPKNMYDAVDKFVQNLHGGRIIKADDKWKQNYARENLVIGITAPSKTGTRCYTFADNGEGQHPEKFPKTFLSLSEKNKSQIPFVQGKYNMGSSGVLNFCKDGLKLIISRRYNKEGDWGWTLIRKNRPQGGLPFAEYFAPGGKIQTIGRGKVMPFRNKGDKFDAFTLETGTIVKLYDFRVGKGYADFMGARVAFNENLVETILPFRIYDFRQTPAPKRGGLRALGIDDRAFYGMEHQLMVSQGDEADEEASAATSEPIPIELIQNRGLGKITITAVPLKKNPSPWYKKSGNRIFHHVNGQVQFKQTRGTLSHCKLPLLKDRIAIFVDASHLSDSAHTEIWKGDREHILDTNEGEQYKNIVRDALRNSETLKALNRKIMQEEMVSVSAESARDLIQDMIASDSNLAMLLSQSVPDIPVPSGPQPEEPLRTDLKYDPTYVRVQGKASSGVIPITLAINKPRPVPCKTDVRDDYFFRAENRGDICFKDDEVADKFSYSCKLKNGKLVVFLIPNREKLKVGDVVDVQFGLHSDSMAEQVWADKTLRISLTKAAKPKPPNPNPRPTSTKSVGLPLPILVTKDGRPEINGSPTQKWDDVETPFEPFDKESGGYVQKLEEGKSAYYINYDNAFFQNALRTEKAERKSELSQKYILGMRILMLGLERAIGKMEQKAEKENDDFDYDKLRWVATEGVASVALTVCDQLPAYYARILADDGGREE